MCASRSMPLLDTSNLDFLNPPSNTPIAMFESPNSPVLVCRVCDECFDQIHGWLTTPHSPPPRSTHIRILSILITVVRQLLSCPPIVVVSLSSSMGSKTDKAVNTRCSSSSRRRVRFANQDFFEPLPSGNADCPPQASRPPLPENVDDSHGELSSDCEVVLVVNSWVIIFLQCLFISVTIRCFVPSLGYYSLFYTCCPCSFFRFSMSLIYHSELYTIFHCIIDLPLPESHLADKKKNPMPAQNQRRPLEPARVRTGGFGPYMAVLWYYPVTHHY
jgi:hypothetical protein